MTSSTTPSKLTVKFCFLASDSGQASQAFIDLQDKYGQHTQEECDVIVALGGDGFLLHTIRENADYNKPIYGMNRGTLGFLMNPYTLDNLPEAVTYAQSIRLHPLKMEATHEDGHVSHALAFNDVSLTRQSPQAAKISLSINGKQPMDELLVGDGVLVSTSMGSTGYNLSAKGPILPQGSNLLALTPIAARPRHWHGALLLNTSEIEFTVHNDNNDRAVTAVADVVEFRNVSKVKVSEDRSKSCTLLYDPEHHLSEKIMRAQFTP